jgi:hypothetical protein
MPVALSSKFLSEQEDKDEASPELLASETMVEKPVAIAEVSTDDVLFAAVGFPMIALIMAYFCN